MTDVRALVRAELERGDGPVPSRAGMAFRYQLAGQDVPIEFDQQQSTGCAVYVVRSTGPNRAQRRATARAARRAS